MAKIGAITVGQSPRDDLVPEMLPVLGSSIELIQMGGLDGLTREEIETFIPEEGDHVLVSRLRDGSSVTFGESYILPRLQDCIRQLEAEGVSLILFLCTGEFPENFQSSVPLIFPNRILTACVPALTPHCRLGVLTPSAEQIRQMTEKWSSLVDSVHVIPVSPYDGLDAVLKAVLKAAREFPADSLDLIVMDCIGYTVEMKEKVRELTGTPVILPRTLLAHILCEIA